MACVQDSKGIRTSRPVGWLRPCQALGRDHLLIQRRNEDSGSGRQGGTEHAEEVRILIELVCNEANSQQPDMCGLYSDSTVTALILPMLSGKYVF